MRYYFHKNSHEKKLELKTYLKVFIIFFFIIYDELFQFYFLQPSLYGCLKSALNQNSPVWFTLVMTKWVWKLFVSKVKYMLHAHSCRQAVFHRFQYKTNRFEQLLWFGWKIVLQDKFNSTYWEFLVMNEKLQWEIACHIQFWLSTVIKSERLTYKI